MSAEVVPSEPHWRRTRPYSTTSGLLLVASTLAPVVAQWGFELPHRPRYALLGGVAATTGALLLSGLTIARKPARGRALATLGILGLAGLAAPALWNRPFLALSASLLAIGSLSLLWNLGGGLGIRLRRRRPVLQNRTRGAAFGALALGTTVAFARPELTPVELWSVGSALLLASALGVAWAVLDGPEHPLRAIALGVALAASALWIAWDPGASRRSLVALALVAATTALVVPGPPAPALERVRGWEPLLGHPERLFTGTFALLCALGTLILALPWSVGADARISLLDAAFTAVSAVCVTGLIVLDTPRDLSAFGQAAVLLLIQLGGLGIMTFSTAALRVFDRRMSLRHEGAVARLISPGDRGRVFGAAQRVLVVTAVAELLGSIALSARFLAHGDSLGTAVWRGIFTAVSAFCNAGFALQTDSLLPYRGDPWILHTVAELIIAGGLAPAALVAVPALARRGRGPVSAQIKLSIAAAGVLLVGGFVLFLAFEWDRSLAGLSVLDRVHNAWFQSATLRTAGFNSIELSAVRPATVTVMLIWMFIGGSPGGTAGGIKTTTAAVLVLGVVSAVRGHGDVTVFGRRLAYKTLQKATVIATLGAAAIVVGILALLLTQDLGTEAAVFEVVSASATVGLSLGATARLDEIGKLIIIACMFSGRVGPLTLLMFLSRRHAEPVVGRPEEEIDVG